MPGAGPRRRPVVLPARGDPGRGQVARGLRSMAVMPANGLVGEGPGAAAGAADRLPDRFGSGPGQEAGWRDLAAALRRAVDEELTARQRQVFAAIVLDGVPLDALVLELGSSRNAICKVLFDARRKLSWFP